MYKMNLPNYNPQLTLENALEQFDLAAQSFLVRPSETNALNVYIASMRWYDVLHKINESDGGIPKELSIKYLRDVDECSKLMEYISGETYKMLKVEKRIHPYKKRKEMFPIVLDLDIIHRSFSSYALHMRQGKKRVNQLKKY